MLLTSGSFPVHSAQCYLLSSKYSLVGFLIFQPCSTQHRATWPFQSLGLIFIFSFFLSSIQFISFAVLLFSPHSFLPSTSRYFSPWFYHCILCPILLHPEENCRHWRSSWRQVTPPITVMKLFFVCKDIHWVAAYLVLGFGFKCSI